MDKPKILRKKNGTVLIERFSPIRRIEHILIILCFVVLVTTGFPQKYYESGLSSTVLQWFGGLDRARFIHRIAGWVMTIEGFLHVGAIVVGVAMARMRLTLLPVTQDFKDVFATMSYYLGHQKEHPVYPKFDYRQKFEYLGMVLGGLIMIVTGLVLIYPVQVAALLPGELIPAARAMHSNEALLALSVLIVWHVYGSHLSPEVFPMDKSIFSGYLTKEELKERHWLEYQRLFPEEAAKELEEKRLAAERKSAEKTPGEHA